jgi:hypothetical protein
MNLGARKVWMIASKKISVATTLNGSAAARCLRIPQMPVISASPYASNGRGKACPEASVADAVKTARNAAAKNTSGTAARKTRLLRRKMGKTLADTTQDYPFCGDSKVLLCTLSDVEEEGTTFLVSLLLLIIARRTIELGIEACE